VQQVVIGSWTPGKHFRAGVIGALLLGIPRPVALSMSGNRYWLTEEMLQWT
jgi:hypothetical protein